MKLTDANRPLTAAEHALARWMLENGLPEARAVLEQLDKAAVTPWRCSCGCASINFPIKGRPATPPSVHILGDYLGGPLDAPFGTFIFESEDFISGIEVYSLGGDAPSELPCLHCDFFD